MNSISKEIIKKRWLICCLLFFHIACNSKKNYPDLTVSINDSIQVERNALAALDSINLYKKIVKTGDLILRTGRDFTSETMKQLSLTDKTYSHCGIASIENDTVFVYHSIGGEWNPNQKLRKDPFEFFCNPYENRGFGIFRYHLTPLMAIAGNASRRLGSDAKTAKIIIGLFNEVSRFTAGKACSP